MLKISTRFHVGWLELQGWAGRNGGPKAKYDNLSGYCEGPGGGVGGASMGAAMTGFTTDQQGPGWTILGGCAC
jgi:hypothetical protein